MIPDHFYPFWTVYDGLGQKYCDCSHEKYAIRTLELHEGEGFTYRRIDPPKPLPPQTVDVKPIIDKELPGQMGLPSAVERLHEDIRKSLRKPFEPLPQSDLQEFDP